MGAKIFPGTPVIVKSGMKATTIIAVEVEDRLSHLAGGPHDLLMDRQAWAFFACARWKKMLSTMISVASTIMPKSMDPSEIKFADCPIKTIIEKVKSSDSGIVRATMQGRAQIAQEDKSKMTKTKTMPLMRISVTVSTVV